MANGQEQMSPAPMEAGQQPVAGGDELTQMITNLGNGLGMFAEALTGVNPELGQQAQALVEGFSALIQKMQGSGPAEQGSSPVSPEAGAAQAMPVGPQGMAR